MDLRNVTGLAAWADGHEKLCGERHTRTDDRLNRIEALLIGTFGTLIVSMGGLIWVLVKLTAKLG